MGSAYQSAGTSRSAGNTVRLAGQPPELVAVYYAVYGGTENSDLPDGGAAKTLG